MAAAVATAALLTAVGGCGNGEDGEEAPASPAGSPTPTESPTATAGEAATVTLREAGGLGPVLTDAEGRTLYLFEADKDGESTCNDACAEAWPPLTTSGEPKAGEQADAELLGTTEREDGSTQVTYNEHPLYYFESDEKPGDTKGQGVDGFGAEWFALNASGERAEDGTRSPDEGETPEEDTDPGY